MGTITLFQYDKAHHELLSRALTEMGHTVRIPHEKSSKAREFIAESQLVILDWLTPRSEEIRGMFNLSNGFGRVATELGVPVLIITGDEGIKRDKTFIDANIDAEVVIRSPRPYEFNVDEFKARVEHTLATKPVKPPVNPMREKPPTDLVC